MMPRGSCDLLAAIATLGLFFASGCASHAQDKRDGGSPGGRDDVFAVQVMSAVVGGKNVFIPSTIAVAAGKPSSLSIFNGTDKPHGFAIAELGVRVVLPAGEETPLDLPALGGGQIFRINCHLHPPHRSASLVVIPSAQRRADPHRGSRSMRSY